MNRIGELRRERKLTQTQMAQMMKVTQGTFSYWERGDFEPDFDNLKKLADFFEVTTDYLLCRTDERKPYFDPRDGGAPLRGVYLRLARDAQEKQLPDAAIERIYELFEEFEALNSNDKG